MQNSMSFFFLGELLSTTAEIRHTKLNLCLFAIDQSVNFGCNVPIIEWAILVISLTKSNRTIFL